MDSSGFHPHARRRRLGNPKLILDAISDNTGTSDRAHPSPDVGLLGKNRLRPRAELWCIFACTLAASYASSLLPESILEAAILTMILSIVLWLAMVQATRRRAYQDLMRRKIARKLGVSEGCPDVRRLANNQDLPQASVAAILVTVQVWLLTSSDEFVNWLPLVFGTPQTFSPGAARTTAFFAGWLVGILYYRYCPNQTEIRELASKLNKRHKRG